ncbi:MAG: DoxX family protein [Vicinamibacterales bacterium]
MQTWLAPLSPYLYAALRIVAGLLFAQHGVQKLFGWLTDSPPVALLSQRGLAGVIETFGGLAIALGAFTSPVAFLASGQMAVAYFQAHLPRGVWPIENGGELAVLYCFLFLYIASRGSGRWSLR